MSIPDHYDVLGVAENATEAEVRRARRRLLRKHHPDISGDADAVGRTRTILVAAAVLSDPEARREYDRVRRSAGATHHVRPPAPRENDWPCSACMRSNRAGVRSYCIFCGAGIGPSPAPIVIVHGGLRETLDPLVFRVGCGIACGTAVAFILVLGLGARWNLGRTSVGLLILLGSLLGALPPLLLSANESQGRLARRGPRPPR